MSSTSSTCGRYSVNNIPCCHAVAFINKDRGQPRDYIPAVFSLATYEETYSAVNFLPVDTSELPESGECGPPLLRKPRGRPKEKGYARVSGAVSI